MFKILYLKLTFIVYIILSSSVYSIELEYKNLKEKFLIFIEKEFLNHNIKVKNHRESFIFFDKKNNQYLLSLDFIDVSNSNQNFNQNKFLPILTISNKNKIKLSSSSSLHLDSNINLLEIENVSKILVIDTINKLNSKKIYFSEFEEIIKDKSIKKIKLTFIGFSDCENDKIVEIMEKEFPGYHHVEIGSSSTFKINSYNYFTNSTMHKIKKWINIVMTENNFLSKDYFSKINKNSFDLVKVNKKKQLTICY